MNLPDLNSGSFWASLSKKNHICIEDEQAIMASMDKGTGTGGETYAIQSVKTIKESDRLCQWTLIEMSDLDKNLLLVIKTVGDHIDIYCMYQIPEIEGGSRYTQLERENFWMFREPEDPDDFHPSDLLLSEEIVFGEEDVYNIKGQGFMTGNCGKTIYGINEYICINENSQNPQLLILEETDMSNYDEDDEDPPGWMSFYLGSSVNPRDLQVI